MLNREMCWFSLLLVCTFTWTRQSLAPSPCASDTALCDDPRDERCSECPPNSRRRHACNSTHDTVCECNKGHYNQHPAGVNDLQVTLTCRPCDLCPHGWGATRPCSSTHNTVCWKCPLGTYSSVVSASRPCAVCATCREDQIVVHECTPIQDTVCLDKEGAGRPGRRLIPQLEADSIAHQKTVEDYNNPGVIFIYCAVLGAVVLGLCFYVLLKQWKLRTPAVKLPGLETRYSAPPTLAPSAKSLIFDEGFQPLQLYRNTPLFNYTATPVTLETRLRDMNISKRRELERLLNARRDHADWRALARQLGYGSSRIQSFEHRSFRHDRHPNPTRHLLADWSRRSDSTLGRLLQALSSIGRCDVTLALLPIRENTDDTLLPCSPPSSTSASVV